MPEVRMKTLRAGPKGVVSPGESVSLSKAEAKAAVSGGYAEAIEAAVIEPPEKAVVPKVKPKRSGKRKK